MRKLIAVISFIFLSLFSVNALGQTSSNAVPISFWVNGWYPDDPGHATPNSAADRYAELIESIANTNQPDYYHTFENWERGPEIYDSNGEFYKVGYDYYFTITNKDNGATGTHIRYAQGAVRKEYGVMCWDGSYRKYESLCPIKPACGDNEVFDEYEQRCKIQPLNEKQYGRCPTGAESTGQYVGNPINIAIGNKLETQTDYRDNGIANLRFTRAYNSGNSLIGVMGSGWKHNYERHVSVDAQNTIASVYLEDGRVARHRLIDGIWFIEPDMIGELTKTTTGWEFRLGSRTDYFDSDGSLLSVKYENGHTETLTYDTNNQLIKVVGVAGASITFAYHPNGRLASMTAANRSWGYRYDIAGRLEYVDNPDSTQRQFHYENTAFP